MICHYYYFTLSPIPRAQPRKFLALLPLHPTVEARHPFLTWSSLTYLASIFLPAIFAKWKSVRNGHIAPILVVGIF